MELQVGSNEPLYQIMLARYYSSSLGRFMAADPGDDTDPEVPQSWNHYSYTRNNPIAYVDSDGEQVILPPSAFGGADPKPPLAPGGDIYEALPPGGQKFLDNLGKVLDSITNFVLLGAMVDGAGSGEIGEGTSGLSKSASEMASEVSQETGKNSVSFETPSVSGRIDLQGKAHFDKATGETIPTPHVQTQTKHVGPGGQVNLSGNVQTRPATKQDIRTARKLLTTVDRKIQALKDRAAKGPVKKK